MFKLSKKKQILSGKMVFGSKFSQKKVENCPKWAKMGENGPKLHENLSF